MTWPLIERVYPEPTKFADNWRLEHRFKPNMSQATRERKLAGWARAVKGVLASDEGLLMTPRRTDTDGFFVSVLRRS